MLLAEYAAMRCALAAIADAGRRHIVASFAEYRLTRLDHRFFQVLSLSRARADMSREMI